MSVRRSWKEYSTYSETYVRNPWTRLGRLIDKGLRLSIAMALPASSQPTLRVSTHQKTDERVLVTLVENPDCMPLRTSDLKLWLSQKQQTIYR